MAPYQEEIFSDDQPSCVDTNTPNKPLSQEAHKDKHDDPFLYYSNDDIRMKTLKLVEVSEKDTVKEGSRHESFSNDQSSCVDTKTPNKPLSQEAHKDKHDVPFLYYSSDDIQMKTLTLVEVSEKDTVKEGSRHESWERKTRISFELHPSLILDDMLEEIVCDDDDLDDIDYDFGGDNAQAELLRELFQ